MARGTKNNEKLSVAGGLGHLFEVSEDKILSDEKRDYFSVGEFLEELNFILREKRSFVAGEVTDFRAHDKWVSFSLKDKEDNSILKCFLSVWTYRKSGVLLEDGIEIKVGGYPRIYKLAGTFSFNVETIEPLGEGSLKKAYLLLLKKFEEEGLFARKREIPRFIKNIGIISSKDGVVIHDFMKNLNSLGFKIKFWNSRVEGSEAVSGIISGLKYLNLKEKDLDVVVIMRGGGSLESMQAFNNEQVCREIFASKIPVICGIGHEIDVPISSLVADIYVSTPTATAYVINESWNEITTSLPLVEKKILSGFSYVLKRTHLSLPVFEKNIVSQFNFLLSNIRGRASSLSGKIFSGFRQVFSRFNFLSEKVTRGGVRKIGEAIDNISLFVKEREKYLSAVDPGRNLRLGYSIVFNKDGRVVKSVKDVKKGEVLITRVCNGEIESEVSSITN